MLDPDNRVLTQCHITIRLNNKLSFLVRYLRQTRIPYNINTQIFILLPGMYIKIHPILQLLLLNTNPIKFAIFNSQLKKWTILINILLKCYTIFLSRFVYVHVEVLFCFDVEELVSEYVGDAVCGALGRVIGVGVG